jgi:hypothetical protein
MKFAANRGINQNIYFWRDQQGTKADLLTIEGNHLSLYEIKSAQTVSIDVFVKLEQIQKIIPQESSINLIYGGSDLESRTKGQIIGWKSLSEYLSNALKRVNKV